MDLKISDDWKEDATKINCGGFRKIYIYKNFILKVLYKKTPFTNFVELYNTKYLKQITCTSPLLVNSSLSIEYSKFI